MVRFAGENSTIKTLARGEINDIEAADATRIVVRSRAQKSTASRILLKKDFRYAWSILEARGALTLDDLEPRLTRRKSIVMAFLSKARGVSHSTTPLTLYVSSDAWSTTIKR